MSDIEGSRWVLVKVTPELMEQWTSRTIDCDKLVWDWGKPDYDGYYAPTVTIDRSDNPLTTARAEAAQQERERLRAIVLEYYESEFTWRFVHDRLLADPEEAV